MDLQPMKPLFYLTTIGHPFLFAPSPIIVATLCRLPIRAAEWQQELTNDSCQVKCGYNAYMIRAFASGSQLCSYIIGSRFLYLKFFVLLYSLSSNIIAYC